MRHDPPRVEDTRTWLTRAASDLGALTRQCATLDASLARVGERAARLTDYAWKYRYPGEPSEPGREEAESALKLAREVYDAVLERLPAEVRLPDRQSS